MRAPAGTPLVPQPDPEQTAVMGMVHAYQAASREIRTLDEQRRLLRHICTRLRAHLRRAEKGAPGSAPELAARMREHRRIIAGMERLLNMRFDADADWRGRYLHAMDELVILEISTTAARLAAAAH